MMNMDNHNAEYAALTRRLESAERVAHQCWTAGTLTAAVAMSWGINARNSGLMVPVAFAIAIGFYAMLRGRQQVRAIGGYLEACHESGGEPGWFGRLNRVQRQPGYNTVGEWLTVLLANAGMVTALVLAWTWAESSPRGQLMSGIVTGVAVLFGSHSISETVRMGQTDWTAMWRQARATAETSLTGRAA